MARIEGTLRRSADIRAVSPLTGLPGNHRIEVEVASRAASGHPYALCHVDLDEFKGFNDAYGFSRGDGLLLLLAACLHRAAAVAVIKAVDRRVVLIVAADRHHAQAAGRQRQIRNDRRGELRRTPLCSVSVGIALNRGGSGDHRALVAVAAEMKSVAKRESGSFVAVDRRG